MTDERRRNVAIVAANRVAILATIFTGTETQCARLREALSLADGAPR